MYIRWDVNMFKYLPERQADKTQKAATKKRQEIGIKLLVCVDVGVYMNQLDQLNKLYDFPTNL